MAKHTLRILRYQDFLGMFGHFQHYKWKAWSILGTVQCLKLSFFKKKFKKLVQYFQECRKMNSGGSTGSGIAKDKRSRSRRCQGLFFIKLHVWDLQLHLKRDSDAGASCEFCEIFKNCFFIEHLWWLLLEQ